MRQQHPKAEIGWVVQEPSAQLLRHHPQLDHLIVFPRKEWGKSFWRMMREAGPFIRQLRSYKFDVAIDFQGKIICGKFVDTDRPTFLECYRGEGNGAAK